MKYTFQQFSARCLENCAVQTNGQTYSQAHKVTIPCKGRALKGFKLRKRHLFKRKFILSLENVIFLKAKAFFESKLFF